jgi:hypothetical protein
VKQDNFVIASAIQSCIAMATFECDERAARRLRVDMRDVNARSGPVHRLDISFDKPVGAYGTPKNVGRRFLENPQICGIPAE